MFRFGDKMLLGSWLLLYTYKSISDDILASYLHAILFGHRSIMINHFKWKRRTDWLLCDITWVKMHCFTIATQAAFLEILQAQLWMSFEPQLLYTMNIQQLLCAEVFKPIVDILSPTGMVFWRYESTVMLKIMVSLVWMEAVVNRPMAYFGWTFLRQNVHSRNIQLGCVPAYIVLALKQYSAPRM